MDIYTCHRLNVSSTFKHETFPNSPITEAPIDIQVTTADNAKTKPFDQRLNDFAARLNDQFPVREERVEHVHEIRIDSGVGIDTHSASRKAGYVLFTAVKDKAIQARPNGFAFSKLKPYKNWDALRDEARELWKYYCETMLPSSVIRLAVRYINRIEIPLPLGNFDECVRTGIHIADNVPQAVTEFFFRALIPKPDSQIAAIVTSTIEKSAPEMPVPYIFDIDVFMLNTLDPSSDEVWSQMELLREYKNLIFFNSMTDKAKELFR